MTPTQKLLIRALDHLESALAMLQQASDLTDRDMTGPVDYTECAVNCTWSQLSQENELEFELREEV